MFPTLSVSLYAGFTDLSLPRWATVARIAQVVLRRPASYVEYEGKPSNLVNSCLDADFARHIKAECTVNRLTYGMTELSVEDAWIAVETADEEKEVDEIKAVCRHAAVA